MMDLEGLESISSVTSKIVAKTSTDEDVDTVKYEMMCGNIFVSTSFKYCLTCEFCKHRFEDMDSFINHIQSKHWISGYSEVDEPAETSKEYAGEYLIEKVKIEPAEFVDLPGEFIPLEQSDETLDYDATLSEAYIMSCQDQQLSETESHTNTSPPSRSKRTIHPSYVHCNICNRHFKDLVSLKLHSEKMHVDQIPRILASDPTYRSCKYCKQNFDQVADRIKHEKTHVAEKQFPCLYCPKTFHNRTYYSIHLRSHKKEAAYQCEECGKHFSFSNDFSNHRKKHQNKREFKCDICGMEFNIKIYLNDHKVKHVNERPFACDICSKTFKRKRNLRSHRKLHSGIKDFECIVCGKKFAQAVTLKSHKKKIHSL